MDHFCETSGRTASSRLSRVYNRPSVARFVISHKPVQILRTEVSTDAMHDHFPTLEGMT